MASEIPATRQGVFTEIWAKARAHAEGTEAAQFFDNHEESGPQLGTLRDRIISIWKFAIEQELAITRAHIERLETRLTANTSLRDFHLDNAKVSPSISRRKSIDFSQVVDNTKKFLAEAQQKESNLLSLPKTPFIPSHEEL